MYSRTLKSLFVFTTLYTILTPWSLSITPYVGYLLILTTYFLPVSVIFDKRELRLDSTGKALLLMILVLFLSLSVSFFTDNLISDIDIIKDALAFMSLYCAIAMGGRFYTREDLYFFFRINKILAIVYILYTFFPFSFRYTNAGWGRIFTMNMGNPNGVAINVFFCEVLLAIEYSYEKKLMKKLILLSFMGCIFYTIILLESRTVFLCTIAFFVFVLCRNIPVKKWHCYTVLVVPVIFILISFGIANTGFAHIQLLNKTLWTNRDVLYAYNLNFWAANPIHFLVGSAGQFKFQNAHNGPIAITLNLGIIGFLSYFVFWKNTLIECLDNMEGSSVRRSALLALLIYMLHSSAEAGPVLGMIIYGAPLIITARFAKDRLIE